MKFGLTASLENLTLDNLNKKMQHLRDQLRENVKQDVEYLRYKIKRDDNNAENNSDSANGLNSRDPHSSNQFAGQDGSQHTPNIPIEGQLSNELREECVVAEPVYYRNWELEERQIDYEQLRRINSKKISAGEAQEYMRSRISSQVWQKMKEVWQQLSDESQCVQVRSFVRRFCRLGVRYTQAVAIEIPKIKKAINLKKVLFQLAYKSENGEQSIGWQIFKKLVQRYWHQEEPWIDVMMVKFRTGGFHLASNYFVVPGEVIAELKAVYRRCSMDHFLGYCPVKALITKMQVSSIINKYININVRPKSHLQAALSLKEVMLYIKRKAPIFIDLDEFLLYFSANAFAYYPIEERDCLTDESVILKKRKSQKITRIKSQRSIGEQRVKGHRKTVFNEYMLSTNKANTIRKQKLQEMIAEQQQKKKRQSNFTFKARPVPKSMSQQKYGEFMSQLDKRKQEARRKQEQEKLRSQKNIERLKSETKLFKNPQHPQPQSKKYHFHPKPVPQAILSPRLHQIQKQKSERKHKIASYTHQKYKDSWNQLPHAATQREKSLPKDTYQIFKYYRRSHQIPDYKAEQEKIRLQIEQAKRKVKPTAVQQFYFQTHERHPDHCNRQKFLYTEPHQKEPHYDYKDIIYSPKPEIYYTQKFTEMVIANKNKVYERELSINRKLQQQQERQQKHYNFTKFMKGPLSKLPDTAKMCELQAKEKIQRHRKQWRNLDSQYENNLNQIYMKVIKRPFLYELQSAYSQPKQIRNQEADFLVKANKKKKKKQKGKPKEEVESKENGKNNSF